jgi:hypothetical protein
MKRLHNPLFVRLLRSALGRYYEVIPVLPVEGERVAKAGFDFDLLPVIEFVGLDKVIKQIGLKRVVEEVGLKRVVEEYGPERVLHEMGLDWVLSKMTPAERAKLKRGRN